MPFVRFQTIPFANNLKLTQMRPGSILAGTTSTSFIPRREERPLFRRPLEGVILKERAPAYITVRRQNGEFIILNNTLGTHEGFASWNEADDRAGGEQYYTDFSLFQIQEAREEKFSPQETFGDDFGWFLGQRSVFLSCAGALMNTADFQWRTIWWENYERYLRGTRCVENRARVYLSWDDIMVEGYIIRASATDSANDAHMIPFNFVMWLTGRYSLGALNLQALQAYKRQTAIQKQNEIVGDRETDMLVNGRRISLEPGFLARQLDAMLGTQNPQEAALMVARNPSLLQNVPAYMSQQGRGFTDGSQIREAAANPGQVFGTVGPALKYFNAAEPSDEEIGGIAKTSMAGRTGLKSIFGDDYNSLSKVSYFATTDSADLPF